MSSETEWHRHWKPGLKGKIWQTFIIDNEIYLLKSYFHDGSYGFLFSDCTSMWHEEIGREEIKKRFQKLNPSVEAPVSKLLDHIQEQVDEQKTTTVYAVTFNDSGTVQLSITSKLAGLPFLWKFRGSSADKEMVAQHLTMPLLVMVGELERRQRALYRALTAKDRELEDLRAQGVRASRRHLETTPFDETAFDDNMDTSKEFENQVSNLGRSSLTEAGQRLYGRIMAKDAWLHREVNEDDEGESLMTVDGESQDVGSRTVPGQSWTNRLPPSIAQSGSTSQLSKSPKSSPTKSPQKGKKSAEPSPDKKDTELLRQKALEKRLQEEEAKQEQKAKKKKKMKF